MEAFENINELARCAEAINNGTENSLSQNDTQLLQQDDNFAAQTLEIAEIAAEYSRQKNTVRPNKTLIFSLSAAAALLIVVFGLKMFYANNNTNTTDNQIVSTNTNSQSQQRINSMMSTTNINKNVEINPQNIKNAAKIEIYTTQNDTIYTEENPQFPLKINNLPTGEKLLYKIFDNNNNTIEQGELLTK